MPCFEALTDGTGTFHKLRINLKAKPEHRWLGLGSGFPITNIPDKIWIITVTTHGCRSFTATGLTVMSAWFSARSAAYGSRLLEPVDRPESLRPGTYACRDDGLFFCAEGEIVITL